MLRRNEVKSAVKQILMTEIADCEDQSQFYDRMATRIVDKVFSMVMDGGSNGPKTDF